MPTPISIPIQLYEPLKGTREPGGELGIRNVGSSTIVPSAADLTKTNSIPKLYKLKTNSTPTQHQLNTNSTLFNTNSIPIQDQYHKTNKQQESITSPTNQLITLRTPDTMTVMSRWSPDSICQGALNGGMRRLILSFSVIHIFIFSYIILDWSSVPVFECLLEVSIATGINSQVRSVRRFR